MFQSYRATGLRDTFNFFFAGKKSYRVTELQSYKVTKLEIHPYNLPYLHLSRKLSWFQVGLDLGWTCGAGGWNAPDRKQRAASGCWHKCILNLKCISPFQFNSFPIHIPLCTSSILKSLVLYWASIGSSKTVGKTTNVPTYMDLKSDPNYFTQMRFMQRV